MAGISTTSSIGKQKAKEVMREELEEQDLQQVDKEIVDKESI